MTLALLLALQAAAAPAPAPPALAPIEFDLARYRPAGPIGDCGRGDDAIVVCGRRRGNGDYPMAEMERRYAVHPVVAETGLAGTTTANIHAEAVPMDRGLVSNRIMVGIKLPF